MPRYIVTIPITGKGTVVLDAEDEEAAIEEALCRFDIGYVEDWSIVERDVEVEEDSE